MLSERFAGGFSGLALSLCLCLALSGVSGCGSSIDEEELGTVVSHPAEFPGHGNPFPLPADLPKVDPAEMAAMHQGMGIPPGAPGGPPGGPAKTEHADHEHADHDHDPASPDKPPEGPAASPEGPETNPSKDGSE